jgi:hypothetical protein
VNWSALFAFLAGLLVAQVVINGAERIIRRKALLEGASTLLRRARTKWDTDTHAAIEAENCAMVLERLAGAETTPVIQEKAA